MHQNRLAATVHPLDIITVGPWIPIPAQVGTEKSYGETALAATGDGDARDAPTVTRGSAFDDEAGNIAGDALEPPALGELQRPARYVGRGSHVDGQRSILSPRQREIKPNCL